MKERIVSAIFIVATVVVAFLLRLLDVRLFDLLICFLALACTLEVVSALKDKISNLHKWLALIFPITAFPIAVFLGFFVFAYTAGYALLALTLTVVTFKQEVVNGEPQPIDFSEFGKFLFVLFYPSVPLLFLTFSNLMLGNLSLFALLTVIVTSSISDVFAFVFGSLIKGKKLARAISPNKTVSGMIAGVIGSALCMVILYFTCVAFGYNPFFGLDAFSVILFLVVSGLFFGVTSQAGDLFESALKRSLSVKDTGNLLPGHGGVLDRADSWVFTSVAVYLVFVLYSFLA